jgi:hypothetical protein
VADALLALFVWHHLQIVLLEDRGLEGDASLGPANLLSRLVLSSPTFAQQV